ncbi:MAG: DUF6503 family protein [Balneola sp.]
MIIKSFTLLAFSILSLSCAQQAEIDAHKILDQSISFHDPDSNWDKAVLDVHIQEPRVSNPYRYSIVKLDNNLNTFELSRNRDQYISTHIIDQNGKSTVLLDGVTVIDSTLIEKYRLDASRNIRYKDFYELIYGLPMSLSKSVAKMNETNDQLFNEKESFKVEVELEQPIISKHWNLFISKKDYQLVGIEIFFPDEPEKGERLYFEGIVTINKMKLPRIRHWHTYNDDSYSGSDIIIKEIASE